eukprot:SAG11_NODE_5870_length_1444_cov_1.449814_1_plen_163_part_00
MPKKKDPDAPKRGMSAFMFYSVKRRPQLKAQNPDWAFGEFAKAIGAEWAGMSDKQKKPYNNQAAKDKQRYLDEMEDYEAPSDDDEPKKRKKKDPNAPKRAMTAFMFYSIERRPQLKEEHPDWAFGEFGKQIGMEWREMSDDDKEPYTDQAAADKERYLAETA